MKYAAAATGSQARSGGRHPRRKYRAVGAMPGEPVASLEAREGGVSVGISFPTADQALQWAEDMSDLALLHEE